MVTNEWCSIANDPTLIESWQKKIRHLRKFLRGWARKASGEYKKEKERLLNIIDIQGGSVGIKVNDDIGHYFQTLKGLRLGDPLSPMLFNIAADMLAILIARAKEDGQVGG
jgi:hypothetical protein